MNDELLQCSDFRCTVQDLSPSSVLVLPVEDNVCDAHVLGKKQFFLPVNCLLGVFMAVFPNAVNPFHNAVFRTCPVL